MKSLNCSKIFLFHYSGKLSEWEYALLSSSCSCTRQENLKLKRRRADQELSAIAETMCRYIVAEYTGYKFSQIEIKKDNNGRPYFENYILGISHTEGFVACGISMLPFGVDVEKVADMDDYELIAKLYFHSYEYHDVVTYEGDKLRYFYKIWTLKECYMKCKGIGLTEALSGTYFNAEHDPLCTVSDCIEERSHYFKIVELSEYIISICSELEQIEFEWIDLQEIINMVMK